MFKKKVFISMTIFSILMFLTALIKTQTRIIEKNIYLFSIYASNSYIAILHRIYWRSVSY